MAFFTRLYALAASRLGLQKLKVSLLLTIYSGLCNSSQLPNHPAKYRAGSYQI